MRIKLMQRVGGPRVRAVTTLNRGWLLAGLLAFGVGCGNSGGAGPDGASPPSCTPGASVGCTCINGSTGAQVCESNGTLGACVCAAADVDALDASADAHVGADGVSPAGDGALDAHVAADGTSCGTCTAACTNQCGACTGGACIPTCVSDGSCNASCVDNCGTPCSGGSCNPACLTYNSHCSGSSEACCSGLTCDSTSGSCYVATGYGCSGQTCANGYICSTNTDTCEATSCFAYGTLCTGSTDACCPGLTCANGNGQYFCFLSHGAPCTSAEICANYPLYTCNTSSGTCEPATCLVATEGCSGSSLACCAGLSCDPNNGYVCD